MKTLVNLILVLALVFCTSALDVIDQPDQRHFDRQAIAEFQADPAFNYAMDYAISDSVLTLFLVYLFDWLGSIFNSLGMQEFWPFVLKGFVILVVIAVVYYILKYRAGSVVERQSRGMVPMGLVDVDGHREDYDALVRQSRDNEDFNLAIRYVFLKCLFELDKTELIKISTWKAPLDYVDELKGDKRVPFSRLVELFEVTWYGDYDASEQQLEESFELVETIYG